MPAPYNPYGGQTTPGSGFGWDTNTQAGFKAIKSFFGNQLSASRIAYQKEQGFNASAVANSNRTSDVLLRGYNSAYQIKSGDTMDSIAKANNMDVKAIARANGGMTNATKGTYINLPGQGKNSISNTIPALQKAAQSSNIYATTGQGQAEAYAQANPTNQLNHELGILQYQRDEGIIPKRISFGAVSQMGLTPMQLRKEGYRSDYASGGWVLPQTVNPWTGFAGQAGNRSGTAIRNQKGTLVNGRRRGQENGQSGISVGSNASTAPTTVLASRIGSG